MFIFSIFEARASGKLLCGEEALSVCLVTFIDDPTTSYIAVGTIMMPESNQMIMCGRILLFRYKADQLTMISEKEVNAPPYRLLAFQGCLLAAIGNTVRLEMRHSTTHIHII
jgi:hypothetical protein